MEKICPRCGESSKTRQFVGTFCASCVPIDIKCPPRVKTEACPRCGKKQGDISELALKSCKGTYENARYDVEKGEAIFLVRVGHDLVEVRKPVSVEVQDHICDNCGKAAGGYFEAIIQLRGDPGKITSMAVKVEKLIQRKSFIARFIEQKEGLDFYIGDKKAAEKVVDMIGEPFIRSEKLGGMKEGKRVYRSTFCIRL